MTTLRIMDVVYRREADRLAREAGATYFASEIYVNEPDSKKPSTFAHRYFVKSKDPEYPWAEIARFIPDLDSFSILEPPRPWGRESLERLIEWGSFGLED